MSIYGCTSGRKKTVESRLSKYKKSVCYINKLHKRYNKFKSFTATNVSNKTHQVGFDLELPWTINTQVFSGVNTIIALLKLNVFFFKIIPPFLQKELTPTWIKLRGPPIYLNYSMFYIHEYCMSVQPLAFTKNSPLQ